MSTDRDKQGLALASASLFALPARAPMPASGDPDDSGGNSALPPHGAAGGQRADAARAAYRSSSSGGVPTSTGMSQRRRLQLREASRRHRQKKKDDMERLRSAVEERDKAIAQLASALETVKQQHAMLLRRMPPAGYGSHPGPAVPPAR